MSRKRKQIKIFLYKEFRKGYQQKMLRAYIPPTISRRERERERHAFFLNLFICFKKQCPSKLFFIPILKKKMFLDF